MNPNHNLKLIQKILPHFTYRRQALDIENCPAPPSWLMFGSSSGGYNAALYINGEVEYSQVVYLSPDQTERVVFTVYRATPGNYEVSLGGYRGRFTVVETGYTVAETPAEPSGGLGTPAIIVIVLGSVGVGIAILFATKRRQY